MTRESEKKFEKISKTPEVPKETKKMSPEKVTKIERTQEKTLGKIKEEEISEDKEFAAKIKSELDKALGKGRTEQALGEKIEGKTEEKKEPINIENIGKRKSEYGDYYVSNIERIIMGEQMPASKRKTFNPYELGSEWITGSIGFLDFSEKKEEKRISVGEMGIEPEYRGKGYGKKLVEEVEKIAKQRGMKEIKFYSVAEDNMIGLLKKYGYKPFRGYEPENFVKELKQETEEKNKERK